MTSAADAVPATSSPPRRRLVEVALCAVVAAAAFFALDARRAFGLGDEGLLYLMADDWAAGRPLFAHQQLYPTGQYAFYGALMRLFGSSLPVLRAGHALLVGVGTALLFAALRRAGAGRPAAAALAAAAAFAGAKPLALFACAVVVYAAVDLTLRRQAPVGWVLTVAAVAGALVPVREDSAVLLASVAVVAVVLRRRPAELATAVLPGLLLGFLPWCLLEVARGSGDLAAFTVHTLRRLLFLGGRFADPTDVAWIWPPRWPADPAEAAAVALPFLAVLVPLFYAALLLGQAWRRRRGRGVAATVVTAALLGFAYLPQFAWERADWGHFRTHLPVLLTVVLLAATAATASTTRAWLRASAGGLAVAVAVAALGLSLPSRLHPPPLYPCCQGARIGARVAVPLRAGGLPRREGETMIVLGWAPGWYVVEGMRPGSRHLSTFPRHLPRSGDRVRLLADLALPTNRWVLMPHGDAMPVPDAVRRRVPDLYVQRALRQGVEIWERRKKGEATSPRRPFPISR